MTRFKLLSVVLLSSLMALFLTSCEETTTGSDSPVITSVSHSIAPIGTTITIKGSGFGADDEAGGVWFNTQQAPAEDYVKWTDTEIQVKVPVGATSGKLVVENQGTKSVGVDFFIGDLMPHPVTNLRANSKNDTSIVIKWDASSDANLSIFKGYTFKIISTQTSFTGTEEYGPNVNTLTIGGLTEGEIYEITVIAAYKDNTMSTESKIQWSPASRFTVKGDGVSPIEMFETASDDYGSGLDLFNEDQEGPFALKVINGASWNVGITTKNGVFAFGSASKLGYNFPAAPADAELSEPVLANSIDDVWDTEALDKKKYNTKAFDFEGDYSSFKGKKMVFVARTIVGNGNYQYAKILLDATLRGNEPNRGVQCQVSYQKKAGVPYAITKH